MNPVIWNEDNYKKLNMLREKEDSGSPTGVFLGGSCLCFPPPVSQESSDVLGKGLPWKELLILTPLLIVLSDLG